MFRDRYSVRKIPTMDMDEQLTDLYKCMMRYEYVPSWPQSSVTIKYMIGLVKALCKWCEHEKFKENLENIQDHCYYIAYMEIKTYHVVPNLPDHIDSVIYTIEELINVSSFMRFLVYFAQKSTYPVLFRNSIVWPVFQLIKDERMKEYLTLDVGDEEEQED